MTAPSPPSETPRPEPLLLVSRGAIDPSQLQLLRSDPRVEVYTAAELTRDMIGFAGRVSAVLVAGEDPWSSLVYATTAAVTAPIVVVMPAHLKNEKSDLIAAGAAGCLLLPIDGDDIDHLVTRLLRPAAPSVMSSATRLLLDPVGLTARHQSKHVHLTPREFAMLHFLAQHDGRPMSNQQVYDYVWGDKPTSRGGKTSQQVVAVWAYELRRKLKQLGLQGSLKTIRGFGYALEAEPKRGRGRPRKKP